MNCAVTARCGDFVRAFVRLCTFEHGVCVWGFSSGPCLGLVPVLVQAHVSTTSVPIAMLQGFS